MARNGSPQITIGTLISNVVVPLLIAGVAATLGAGASNAVVGHDSGLIGIILWLFFGAIFYALSLPLYWFVFVREWRIRPEC
ncbi:hypothetical protein [Halovivax limisalsi]|uniref:hypothetical protein n=1 Tax=Halovivax limisalsi TaxID=1453760 RepID=UPI001FFCCA8B|nr:hypothetical protein [Halovivax limisalsi]